MWRNFIVSFIKVLLKLSILFRNQFCTELWFQVFRRRNFFIAQKLWMSRWILHHKSSFSCKSSTIRSTRIRSDQQIIIFSTWCTWLQFFILPNDLRSQIFCADFFFSCGFIRWQSNIDFTCEGFMMSIRRMIVFRNRGGCGKSASNDGGKTESIHNIIRPRKITRAPPTIEK